MAKRYFTASGANLANHKPGHTYGRELVSGGKDRLVHEVMQSIRGLSNKEAAGEACAADTIRQWRKPVRDGGTRYPRAITMNAVLHVHGKRLGVVDK